MSDIDTRNSAPAYEHFGFIRKKLGRTGRAAAGVVAVVAGRGCAGAGGRRRQRASDHRAVAGDGDQRGPTPLTRASPRTARRVRR